MSRCLSFALLLALTASAALAQTAPILTAPPNIQYPPIARAAHVSGDVTVTFSINPDGTTTSVLPVSGPEMLKAAVVNGIKRWTFRTPLPLNAQTHFEAKYTFTVKSDDNEDEDSLDRAPYVPEGDIIAISAEAVTVTGDVHSVDGSQTIDVSAVAPAKTRDNCPQDHKSPPDKTDFNDFVELLHNECDTRGCAAYRVRVYRNGRVNWRGFHGVATLGDSEALIDANAADALVTSFMDEKLWNGCSWPMPEDPKPGTKSAEDDTGLFIMVSIGGITKTVLDSEDDWPIDRTAGTHRWRHVDPASEPYDNMYDDLITPKPGMTLLIRATNHFNPYTGQQTFSYLDKLLKRGESVDAADASGWTALMYASYLDYYLAGHTDGDPFKMLLDARADPNRASLHGDTALMFAAYRGTLLQPLLDHGADINAHNADGVTSLMLLAQAEGNTTDELKAALAAGADPSAHDSLGRTALDYLNAASCGKAIVPLPVPFMRLIPIKPPPCPDTTSASFLASQALLQKAMATKAAK